ncbi:MAG: FAD-dependent oxidoreductase [Pseudomonadota bacterium]|nr:FAD-dependent oxidoreductase [Pseudomonadota bacterium]
MTGRVAVIGAGVVGLACASYLQMRGRAVTLIDPGAPGEYCSSGNAGCFSRASCVPLGLPGSWRNVPGWLVHPDGPLAIAPQYALRVAPWLWRLHRATSLARVNAIADALHALLTVTLDKWRPLAARADASHLIVQRGYAFAYSTERAFAGDALGRALREARGVRIEILTGAAIRDYEPALSERTRRLVVLPEQGHCTDPLALSRALAERLRAGGAQFISGAATRFECNDGHVRAVVTDRDTVATDAVVLAAGAHSKPLAAALGSAVPLETERGYHVTLSAPSVMPRAPLMSGEGKFFATPMDSGLRIAGTVELAGLDAAPNFARADALLQGGKRLLPALRYSAVERWMGHRPSLPDSMPVLGRSPRYANAFFAFGHGHVGLTAAAPTGEIIADLVCGREPYMNVAPFAAERFEQGGRLNG